VIDIGGSYRRSIELLGGDYFALELAAADCAINPFFAHDDLLRPDGGLDGDRVRFLIAVIERMVADHDRPALRQVERAVLHRAIEATYRRLPSTPLLSDLVETLRTLRCAHAEDAQIARALVRGLSLWTTGHLARFFNRHSTIRLTHATRCAAFDLKGVGDDPQLQSVVLLCLSALIWNVVMRDRTERKLVVFDEVWRFFETPASAKLIAELYRTTRKYNASVLALSQSVQDFMSASISEALMNNAATLYMLKHATAHQEIAAELRLNARELAIFESLEMRRGHYTEALVFHGAHHFLARVVLTPLEYWIATTAPADLALEERYRATYGGLSRLQLLHKLAERYPHGATSHTAPQAHVA
jgi:type IV secretory pathway VirB4 component